MVYLPPPTSELKTVQKKKITFHGHSQTSDDKTKPEGKQKMNINVNFCIFLVGGDCNFTYDEIMETNNLVASVTEAGNMLEIIKLRVVLENWVEVD